MPMKSMAGEAAAIVAVASPMPKPISSTRGASRPKAAVQSSGCSRNGSTKRGASSRKRALLATAHAAAAQHVAAHGPGGVDGWQRHDSRSDVKTALAGAAWPRAARRASRTSASRRRCASIGLVRKSFMPAASASSRSEVNAAAVSAMIGSVCASWRSRSRRVAS